MVLNHFDGDFALTGSEQQSSTVKLIKHTVKLLKLRKPEIFAVITLNTEQGGFTVKYLRPKDADGIANSVDRSELGAVWSGTALFAQIYLSENLRSLQYTNFLYYLQMKYKLDRVSQISERFPVDIQYFTGQNIRIHDRRGFIRSTNKIQDMYE